MDDFYRENILDHYKNPRNSGHLEHPTVSAEGVNPLCGDELAVELDVDGGVVQDVRFNGRGCAISQAAASMISDVVKGKTVAEVRALGQRRRARGARHPALAHPPQVRPPFGERPPCCPRRRLGRPRHRVEVRVGPLDDIAEGGVKIVQAGSLFLGIYRIDGQVYALEDRCSHDDGPLCEGEREGFEVVCPRHGARFDLRTGAVLSLPATEDVEAFPVEVRDGEVYVEV